MGVVLGVLMDCKGASEVFRVYCVSEKAQVELKSGST